MSVEELWAQLEGDLIEIARQGSWSLRLAKASRLLERLEPLRQQAEVVRCQDCTPGSGDGVFCPECGGQVL